MKLEPDQQIAVLFLSALVCICIAIAVTYLGPYMGTIIPTLVLTIATLIIAQMDGPFL